MVAANLAELSARQREALEAWLFEFDQSWHESALAATAEKIEQLPVDLRPAVLVEMVKIDLERQWQIGRQLPVESYLERFPQLGTAETVAADLIQAEYDVRRQFGSSADFAQFAQRFPQQAHEVQALVEAAERRRSEDEPGPSPASEADRETSPFAPSTPSLAKSPAESDELSGQFGRYEILKKLGQGGMGTVYLAKDTQLDRPVALKVPHFAAERAEELKERFYREAKAAATIDHPNVCPVHDVGEIDGVDYLTMAYIEGHCLTEFVRPGKPLAQRQVAGVVRKLALALSELHARGIAHRDLKPSNVMINRRREPVIMDFGLARDEATENARLTQSGAVIGTPVYMAPEQVTSDPDAKGPLTDIYGLGVVLYELLTGRLPFEGDPIAVLAQVMSAEPQPPSEHRPDLDGDLEAICLKAMAKQPEDRYDSMADFAAALADYLRSDKQPAAASAASTPEFPESSTAAEGERRDDTDLGQLFAHVAAAPTSSPRSSVSKRRPSSSARRRVPNIVWIAAGGAAALLLVLGVILLIPTRYGTIKITLSDPTANVQVKVDGEEVEITGLEKPLRLRAGRHALEITSPDFKTISKNFTVRRGPNDVLEISLVPKQTVARVEPPGPAGRQPPALAGASSRERIVLSWRGPGGRETDLWLFSLDGTVRTNITNTPDKCEIQPRFSPDGRYIAFTRGDGGAHGRSIWICDADGSRPRCLVSAERDAERFRAPVWVSETRIFYTYVAEEKQFSVHELWQVDVVNGEAKRLYYLKDMWNLPQGEISSVSPDGRQLAIQASNGGWSPTYDIYIVGLDGGGLQPIWEDSPDDWLDFRPQWSRDGKTIAWGHCFTRGAYNDPAYYGVAFAQRGPANDWTVKLQPNEEDSVAPLAWSPSEDGLLCGRVRREEGKPLRTEVFLMNTDFEEAEPLFEVPNWDMKGADHRERNVADWAVVPMAGPATDSSQRDRPDGWPGGAAEDPTASPEQAADRISEAEGIQDYCRRVRDDWVRRDFSSFRNWCWPDGFVYAGPDETWQALFVTRSTEHAESYLASVDEVVPMTEPPVYEVQGPLAIVQFKKVGVRVGGESYTVEDLDVVAQHEGSWRFVFGFDGNWEMTPEDRYDPDNADHVALQRLLDQTEDAMVRKDAESLRDLLHPGFCRIMPSPTGPHVGGAADYTDEMLQEWATEKYAPTITAVKVSGPLAVTLSEIEHVADGQRDTLHGVLHFHGRTGDGWRQLAWVFGDWSNVFTAGSKRLKAASTRGRDATSWKTILPSEALPR